MTQVSLPVPAPDIPRARTSRHVLDNGLRVLLVPDRSWGRVASSVHHEVGFRHERPGEEGLAHVVEHLLFEGGASVPEGSFRTPINAAGGLASGTTHQDYTDLYQVFPEELLELVVFQEADRLREPRFSAAGLATQLDEIEHEIVQAKTGRPFAGLPWPMLPNVLFDSFQNAHDGYGEVARLRSLSPQDVESFFWEHYAPESAVLTLVGAFDPDRALGLIEQHLGSIPARTPRRVAPLAEEPGSTDRWVTCTDPLAPTAGAAIGFRLPDPGVDLSGYLAHQVLGSMVPALLGPAGAPGQVGTSCGFFGALDTVSPDVLVLTSVDPALAQRPEHLPGRVRSRLADLSETDLSGWERAVRRVTQDHDARHHELMSAARTLGRYEALWGDGPAQAERIHESLAGLGPDDLLRSAHDLADQSVGGVLVTPGAERTDPARYERSPGYQGTIVAPPRSSPALALPLPSSESPLQVPAHHDSTGDGLRVVTVQDPKVRDAIVRWRGPLGPRLWRDHRAAQQTVHAQEQALVAATGSQLPSGTPTLSTDGEWWQAQAQVPLAELPGLLRALADVRAQGALPGPDGPAAPPRLDPFSLVTAVQRAGWADPAASGRRTDATGADETIVVLAPGSPEELAEVVRRSLVDAASGERVDSSRAEAQTPAAGGASASTGRSAAATAPAAPSAPAGDLLSLPDPASPEVVLGLSIPVRAAAEDRREGSDEAARYLATAVIGAYHDSRLVRRFPWRPQHGITAVLTGRDQLAGVERTFIRGSAPAATGADFLQTVLEELRRIPESPVSAEELERARAYCRHQARCIMDSPAGLADSLASTLALGKDPAWLWSLTEQLDRPGTHEVQAAAVELFTESAPSLVLAGAVPAEATQIITEHQTHHRIQEAS